MNTHFKKIAMVFIILMIIILGVQPLFAARAVEPDHTLVMDFPRNVDSYGDESVEGYFNILMHRIRLEPFNAAATIIFICVIIHVFFTNYFQRKSHELEAKYHLLIKEGKKAKNSHSMPASLLHFLGEVEAVFGLWAIVLAFVTTYFYSWGTFVAYVNHLDYTEPLFKIAAMGIASTRPILKLFELLFFKIVKWFGNTLEAWWLTILIIMPLMGSFITEPAAMTIGALLLVEKFYVLNPSRRLKYVTLALLFSNISIGGTLTNLSGTPVLMVAGPWDWSTSFMFFNFGLKAIFAIVLSTGVYYWFLKEDFNDLRVPYENLKYKRYIQHKFISQKDLEESFEQLEQVVDKRVCFTSELDGYSTILKENIKLLAMEKLTPEECILYDIDNAIDEKFELIKKEEMRRTLPGLLPPEDRPKVFDESWDQREDHVPYWVMFAHVLFLIWTVYNAHEPVMFMAGFVLFLGFYHVTSFYQNRLDLKPALLVALFLSGLMIHGSLQGWWIAPLIANLSEIGLKFGTVGLSSINDNASIMYLSTLVSDFPDTMKYAVFTGAISGGGLTIIANTPNAIGGAILKKHFKSGISAVELFKYAIVPTMISAIIYFVLR